MTDAMSFLESNPFNVLGVTSRDGRAQILARAEELALHGDSRVSAQARAELTNPRSRGGAEVGWMLGVAPGKTARMLELLVAEPLQAAMVTGLPDLARANLMVSTLQHLDPETTDAAILADIIQTVGELCDKFDMETIQRDINEDRGLSQFPPVREMSTVESDIEALKKRYQSVIKEALDNMPSMVMVDTMTALVARSTSDATKAAPALVDEITDRYELETQSFLTKEVDNIETLIEQGTEQAAAGDRGLDATIRQLQKVVRNWCRVALPVQMAVSVRGLEHTPSGRVGFKLRDFAILLFNEHTEVAPAEAVLQMVRVSFPHMPTLLGKLAEDEAYLVDWKANRANADRHNDEWNAAITYSAEVGLIITDKLSISPSGINWKSKHFSLDEVTGVRWGSTRHSVNGIPTGTDYTIGVRISTDAMTVSLRREATYDRFTNCLWRAVAVRLLVGSLQSLRDGSNVSFGGFTLRDNAVYLPKNGFFGKGDWEWVPLAQTVMNRGNGNLMLTYQPNRKLYLACSYKDEWNIHLLGRILTKYYETAGFSKLSDYLED